MTPDLHQTIVAALESETPPTQAQCAALIQKLAPVLVETVERRDQIAPPHGPVYQKIIRTGTADQIKALQEEYEQVKFLADQLTAQRDELHRLRAQANIREAHESLPGLHKKLVSALGAAEGAAAALQRSIEEMEAIHREIYQARARCRFGGLKPANAKPETIRRLAALYAARMTPPHRHAQALPEYHIDNLGVDAKSGVEAITATEAQARWIA